MRYSVAIMPEYAQSYWTRTTKPVARTSRTAAKSLKGHHTADVVVIGGGLTGCATAYALANAGLQVMLLEAETVAAGATSRAMGAVVPTPDLAFSLAAKAAGTRPARVACAEVQRGAKDLASTLTKLRVSCELSSTDLLVSAPFTNDAAQLKKDVAARKAAKLDGTWLAASTAQSMLATETQGAMRLKHTATLNPVKATRGLAAAAVKKGVTIVEHARVTRTTFTRKDVTIVLAGATITATGVVVATGQPGKVFHQLERHVRTTQGYMVVTEPLPAAMRRMVGPRKALYTEFTESPRWLRWLADGRAMFGGLTGPDVAAPLRKKAVIQRANQLMYELSLRYPDISGLPPAYGWDVPVVTTADGLPWIGPHRNYPFHFFALALGWHGEAWSWVAAQAAVRHFTGKATKDDALLGFARAL
jgi:glycine/D-amino acid oxidase-like deaminating enzyme